MNVQEQVARLEALLTRVQHNGALLRKERGQGETQSRAHSSPAETPRAAPGVHGTPTKLLPTSIEATEQANERLVASVRSTPPPKPSSIPAAAPTLIPASNAPLETDYTGPDVEDGFGREESTEHTKPLWVGISGVGLEPPQPALAPTTVPPEVFTPLAAAAGPSLPPLPEDTLEPGPHGFEPVPVAEALDSELRDSSPPLSGERPSTRSPSLPAQDGPLSLEEPLASAVGAQIPAPPQPVGSDPEAGIAISTAALDTDGDFAHDREGRISDVPASTLGATITLPEDDVGGVELELAEPPPSSLRTIAPAPRANEDELEAELPRTSYRAGYDDSLSAPPAAREELIAHDLSVRERVSSAPSPGYVTEPPISEVTHQTAAYVPPPEDDLPPVLSSRPQSPVTIPPQSTVEPLRASADREEVATFDAPAAYETTPQRAFDAPPDEQRASVPPYQTTVSDVVLSARPHVVEFKPPAHAVAATFEGAVTRAKDATFVELLDLSLSLSVRA